MCDERQFVVYSEIINCWRADVYRGRFHWDRQDKNKSNEVKQMDWERKRREKKGIAVVGTECSIECDWRADAIDFSYSEHVYGLIGLILSGSEHNCDFCVSASWANLSSNFIAITCDKINIVCVSCDCDVVDQTDQEPIHLNKINNGINSNKSRMIIRWHRNIVLSCGYLVLRK